MATKVKVKPKAKPKPKAKAIAKGREVEVQRMDQEPEMVTVVEVLDLDGEVAETHRLEGGESVALVFMPTHSVSIKEVSAD